MTAKPGVDLNSLLKIGNIIICAIGIYLYCKMGSNQYVNGYTLIILCIFVVQNLLILLYEKKRRDPFVLVLMITTLVFYIGRVITLLYDPWSTTFSRSWFAPYDLNYSLVFIILSNTSIFLGLSTAGGKVLYKQNVLTDGYPANPRNVIIILLVTIVIAFYMSLAGDIIGRFSGYISRIFINVHLILLLTFLYFAINFRLISRWYQSVTFILIASYVILHTLCGNRSGLLIVANLLLIVFLSVKGEIRFPKKVILITPVLIFCFIILFISATYIRQVDSNRTIISRKQITLLKGFNIFAPTDVEKLYRPISSRIGFLDYSAIIIRNKEKYSKVLNLTSELLT